MIAVNEINHVRLEIDFEMLTGEVPIFERHIKSLTLDQVMSMWNDYIKGSRLQVTFVELGGSEGYVERNRDRIEGHSENRSKD